MIKKRYYQRELEGYYYIIDSEVISKKDFDEKYENDSYRAFEDSLTVEEIVDLLNENEQLKQEIMEWKEKYFYSEETVINEYSSSISKDMEELQKEVYGDVK